jgi:transposase-like protein
MQSLHGHRSYVSCEMRERRETRKRRAIFTRQHGRWRLPRNIGGVQRRKLDLVSVGWIYNLSHDAFEPALWSTSITVSHDRYRQVEVLTVRRLWRRTSDQARARIVAGSLEAGAVVPEVARRSQGRPQPMFRWWRAMRHEPAAVALVPTCLTYHPRRRRHQRIRGSRLHLRARSCASRLGRMWRC